MMIPMKRTHDVILTIVSVMWGVTLLLSPGGALAVTVDVLTINGTSYFLDETITNTIQTGPLGFSIPFSNPPPPSFVAVPTLIQLQEMDPLTGIGLVAPSGGPVISDNLSLVILSVTAPIFEGSIFYPCGVDICFRDNYRNDYSVLINLTSDSDGGGLPFEGGLLVPELAGGNDLSYITGGQLQLIVISDVDVPSVPEPSTWLLLGSGLAGLAAWRRWRPA